MCTITPGGEVPWVNGHSLISGEFHFIRSLLEVVSKGVQHCRPITNLWFAMRRKNPPSSRWKKTKCNLERISEINWIPITDKPIKRLRCKRFILLDSSKTKMVSYSAMRTSLALADGEITVFQKSFNLNLYHTIGHTRGTLGAGKHHHCSRSPSCQSTAGCDKIRLWNAQSVESRSYLAKSSTLRAWCFGRAPKDWQTGVIIPLHRKGDMSECTNYWGVSLLSLPVKRCAKSLEKICREINEPKLDDTSTVFVVAVALQTKFSLSRGFNFWEILGVCQKRPHMFYWPRKHTTRFLVKSFGECWSSTVLTAACYWLSSCCIPAQKFMSVTAEWQPFTVGVGLDKCVCCHHSSSQCMWIWIDSHSPFDEVGAAGLTFCFCERLVPLASSQQDLQHALSWFSAACDQAGMKVSSKQTEVLCLSRTRWK